nr:phosphoesterase [Nitrospira sp.]
EQAYDLRCRQAKFQKDLPLPSHHTNGDEDRFANKIASYSKGLPHNALGEVDISAYDKMVQALQSGRSADFEIIPMGEANPAKRRKLVNPQSGLAFDYAGADSHHLSQLPAPLFSSAEQAGEMVENYWMALTRDISFTEYDSHPLTTAAVNDLTTLTDFRGPKIGGTVTTKTLFRGLTPGDLMGPYLSQFLLKAAKFGAEIIDQRIQTTEAGKDFMTQYADWLQVQRGTKQPDNIFDPILRYIRNGRDAGQYVHIDVLFQGYFDACLILAAPVTSDPATSGYGVPCNPGNPYVNSLTQEGFGTFGPPHIKGCSAKWPFRH